MMSDASNFTIEIKEFAPITVASVRHTGPYSKCEVAFNKLFSWATQEKIPVKEALFLGIPHDDPATTLPENLRYDACVEIPQDMTVSGNITKQNVEGGRYACYLMKGSYSQFPEAYETLCGKWLPSSGEKMRNAPPVEIYYNSPHDTPEENLLTEIRIPLV